MKLPALPARLRYLAFLVQASFWFVPGLLVAGALLLAAATLWLDSRGGDWWLERLTRFNLVDPEGARAILSTTAGALITVTSLVFSMTLVTLTLASSQLGPRLLKTFVRDPVNQVILGTFAGTFVYSLTVLVAVHGGPNPVVPNISITTSLALTLVSVGALIYFIHHLAGSIQADTVIATVGQELDRTISHMFARDRAEPEPPEPERPSRVATVHADTDGYVQAISFDGLLHLAEQHDLVVRVGRRAGDAVIAGAPVACAWPAERVDERLRTRIREGIAVGPVRTPTQDVDFSVKALVEIALRALSPGINDLYTAVASIDRLNGALAHAVNGRPPPTVRAGSDGRARLVTPPVTFGAILDGALEPIRLAARDNLSMLVRLIDGLTSLAELADNEPARRELRRHGRVLAATARGAAVLQFERHMVTRRLQALRAALHGRAGV